MGSFFISQKLENLIEDLGIRKIEIGNFSIATPSVVGNTKTISFKNSFAKVPILFISQTNYSGTTNEWAAIQTSKITTTNFIARHAGGTSNFTPTFYYVAIELLS